jgi:phosphatidylserine decarboxylase
MNKKKAGALCVLLIVCVVGFIAFFNRAPERVIPAGNVITSPANGDIIHIEKSDKDTVTFFKNDTENTISANNISKPYSIVVIEMDPSDVHVQRSPISGSVVYQEHVNGAHKNALSSPGVEKLANVNEKNIIFFENNDIKVGVIQVAGLAARRIRSFVTMGDVLARGDIYGRIILGSQVVMILPESAHITAQVGDTLIDGESIVAQY